ncbi:MAG: D-alanine--D-alanine ligase [Bacteroidales bacterium]|nr:D-alanine--D-alanine ligase [Bacteroidales bacterium]MCF8352686.1 D-alanine--D-alanine ligase [Bacteroidales bacterium]MCF8376620.1 D-alanine--D-alanine ligase [Bacteroidales bacterium]MCF8400658.1 D-alanine--D-alanine ligase [Bacteroidales bacterium]
MKKKIAIVAGGDSGEYEVSMNSGNVVYNSLNRDLYEPYLIIIKGKEWNCHWLGKQVAVDKNDFSVTLEGKHILFDCVFVAIHGTPGEDGKLQGYFEMLGIPYTTSDWIVSSLTFDKNLSRRLFADYGMLQAKTLYFKEIHDKMESVIMGEVGLPCFIKPNKGGSSVGITKVKEKEQIMPAVELAFREDNEILVEEFIDGTEITCGVFRHEGRLVVLPITEIVSKNEFFDYEAKYTKGMADEITPARISVEVEKECKRLSAFLYNKMNCRGIVRFDYIFNDQGMYFLELNTVPGLSEASIVPQQAEDMGISIGEVFSMVIEETLSEYQEK